MIKTMLLALGFGLNSLSMAVASDDQNHNAGEAALQIKQIQAIFAAKDESYLNHGQIETVIFDRYFIAILSGNDQNNAVQAVDIARAIDHSKGPACDSSQATYHRSHMVALMPRFCLKEEAILIRAVAQGAPIRLHNVYWRLSSDDKKYAGIFLPYISVKAKTADSLVAMKHYLDANSIPYQTTRMPRTVDVLFTGTSLHADVFALAHDLAQQQDVESAEPTFFDLDGPVIAPSMGTGN